MKRIGALLLALSLLAPATQAATLSEVRRSVEGSMQVTGRATIAADGTLASYVLDDAEALPEDVRTLVSRWLPSREFSVTTASGKPEAVETRMRLQVVAKYNPGGGSLISVAGSDFTDPDTPNYITRFDMPPPRYPMDAARDGLTGTVYLVLRLKPDGSVIDAHVEQVNMTVLAEDRQLAKGRALLAKAARTQAFEWRFTVDPQRQLDPTPLDVRVPVDFRMKDMERPGIGEYGTWRAYVPGPRQPIPWLPEADQQGLGALASGAPHPLDAKIKVINAPEGG